MELESSSPRPISRLRWRDIRRGRGDVRRPSQSMCRGAMAGDIVSWRVTEQRVPIPDPSASDALRSGRRTSSLPIGRHPDAFAVGGTAIVPRSRVTRIVFNPGIGIACWSGIAADGATETGCIDRSFTGVGWSRNAHVLRSIYGFELCASNNRTAYVINRGHCRGCSGYACE